MINRFSEAWLRLVTGYPKIVLGVIVLILLASAMGLPRFKLDASADSLTLEHDTDVNYLREVSKNYGSGDFLVVTFTPKDDLFSDASLELLRNLQNDLTKIQGVTSVNSILNVPLLYSPKQSIREITTTPRTLETPNIDRALAKQEFLTSPIYRELILGPDGQTTALQLNIDVDRTYIELVQKRDALKLQKFKGELSEEGLLELEKAAQEFLDYRTISEADGHLRVQQVRQTVAKYKDRAQIFVGGLSMITADMISFIKKDLVLFGSAAILFMIAVLVVIFRSWRFVIIPMATCLSAVLFMLGLISWLDWRLTVMSSNFVALLLIISLSIMIHLVVLYREYADKHPSWSQEKLVRETLKFMAMPCIYTSLTTIVAFMSLVVSDIRPVMDFGWMMTIGLVFALTLAFLLLPASLMLLKRPLANTKRSASTSSEKPFTLYCSHLVEKFGKSVLVVSVLVACLSVWGLTLLQVENRFIDYFHEETEIYQGLSLIDNKLGGTTSLDIIVDAEAVALLRSDDAESSVAESQTESYDDAGFAGEDDFAGDEFESEETLSSDADFAGEEDFEESDGFEGTDQFPSSNSVSGHQEKSIWMTVTGLAQVEKIHNYLESMPEIGKVQSLATLYQVGKDINGGLNNFELAVMENSLSGDVRSVLLDPYIRGETETRITMRVKDSYPGLKRAELVERIRNHLGTELKLDTNHVHFTGILVLYNNMLQSLYYSQIVTLGVVFLGIFVMFVILFRSVIIAIIAITPNILAAVCILGGMGLAGIPLDMMTITIAAITVGIGVDDTIHYIHRFKSEVAKDGDYIAAMHRSHASIGRAMYYTSVIIIFGFSIMVMSEFFPTIYFGLLTGLAMLAALSGALFLLPKLILMLRPFAVSSSARAEIPEGLMDEV